MRKLLALLFAATTLALAAGASLACDDIECPKNWVWSDKEGTCIHVSEQTS